MRPFLNPALLIVSLLAGAYLMAVAVTVPRFPWLGWITLFPIFTAIYHFGARVGSAMRTVPCVGRASPAGIATKPRSREATKKNGESKATRQQGNGASSIRQQATGNRQQIEGHGFALDTPRPLFLRAFVPPCLRAFPIQHPAFTIPHSLALRSSLFALFCGALWGAALYVFLALWNFPAVASGGAAPIALLVLLPALFTLGGVWLTRWIGFSPFVLAFSWLGVELALTPLGLRHGLLAETQSHLALFPAVGHFLGYVLVAFAVAYFSAMLVSTAGRLAAIVIRQTRRLFTGGVQLRTFLPQAASPPWPAILFQLSPRAPPVKVNGGITSSVSS